GERGPALRDCRNDRNQDGGHSPGPGIRRLIRAERVHVCPGFVSRVRKVRAFESTSISTREPIRGPRSAPYEETCQLAWTASCWCSFSSASMLLFISWYEAFPTHNSRMRCWPSSRTVVG